MLPHMTNAKGAADVSKGPDRPTLRNSKGRVTSVGLTSSGQGFERGLTLSSPPPTVGFEQGSLSELYSHTEMNPDT